MSQVLLTKNESSGSRLCILRTALASTMFARSAFLHANHLPNSTTVFSGVLNTDPKTKLMNVRMSGRLLMPRPWPSSRGSPPANCSGRIRPEREDPGLEQSRRPSQQPSGPRRNGQGWPRKSLRGGRGRPRSGRPVPGSGFPPGSHAGTPATRTVCKPPRNSAGTALAAGRLSHSRQRLEIYRPRPPGRTDPSTWSPNSSLTAKMTVVKRSIWHLCGLHHGLNARITIALLQKKLSARFQKDRSGCLFTHRSRLTPPSKIEVHLRLRPLL